MNFEILFYHKQVGIFIYTVFLRLSSPRMCYILKLKTKSVLLKVCRNGVLEIFIPRGWKVAHKSKICSVLKKKKNQQANSTQLY